MGAVVALAVRRVVGGEALIHIVESEGNLGAAVQSLSSDDVSACVGIQIGQHLGNVRLGQGILVGLGISREGRMIQIQTGIDDGDLHTGAGVTQLFPDSVHTGHGAGGSGVGGSSGCGVKDRSQEDALDALEVCDLLQIAEGSLDGEGIGQVGELVANFQLLTAQDGLLNVGDDSILLLDHLLFQVSRDQSPGLVAVSQGLVFHHDESVNHFFHAEQLGSSLQLFQAFVGFGGQQRNSGLALGGLDFPAVIGHFAVVDFHLQLGLIAHAQTGLIAVLLSDEETICIGRSLDLGCFILLFGFLLANHAQLGSRNSRCCGCQSGEDHAEGQKDGKQTLASHSCSSLLCAPADSSAFRREFYGFCMYTKHTNPSNNIIN